MISERVRKSIVDTANIVIAIAAALITYLLFITDRDHARDEHRRAAVDFLLRLKTVMDETPTTRPCMRYVLLNTKPVKDSPLPDSNTESGEGLFRCFR